MSLLLTLFLVASLLMTACNGGGSLSLEGGLQLGDGGDGGGGSVSQNTLVIILLIVLLVVALVAILR